MEEVKIREIIDHIIAKLKPYDKKGFMYNGSGLQYPYPEYYEGYNEIVAQYEDILVHTKYGTFPEKLLGRRAPNMTDEEWIYVKNNYKSWTVPLFIDFLNSVKDGLTNGDTTVNWPDTEGMEVKYLEENSLRKYLEYGIEEYGSIDNLFKFLFPSLRLQDVNGGLVVRPKHFIKKEDENTALGFQYYEIPTELRQPMPYYYNCKQVILPMDEFVVIELSEKSICTIGGKKDKVGRIWELHTKDEIYRIFQVGKYEKYEYEITLMVQHDIGEIQFKRNGGMPDLIDGKLHFVAEMLYAVPNLDLVLLNKSNLQLGNNNGVYPIRVMIGNECDFEDKTTGQSCNGGGLYDANLTNKRVCPKCNGSGLKSRITPMGNILIKGKTTEGEQEIKASEAIYSHSTDTSTLEFLMKCIKEDRAEARSFLHLKNGTAEGVGENVVESSSAAKAHAAFVKPIIDQCINMRQWVTNQIGKWREGAAYRKIVIVAPATLYTPTQADYISEIKDAVQAGLPPFVIRATVYKFLKTLYYTDSETSKMFELIMAADDLLVLSDNQINAGELKGTVAKWQIILHQSAPNLIGELVRDNPKFFELEMAEQIDQLNELAKEKETEINPSVEDSNINTLNGQEVQ